LQSVFLFFFKETAKLTFHKNGTEGKKESPVPPKAKAKAKAKAKVQGVKEVWY
jgi:hypothetical protein